MKFRAPIHEILRFLNEDFFDDDLDNASSIEAKLSWSNRRCDRTESIVFPEGSWHNPRTDPLPRHKAYRELQKRHQKPKLLDRKQLTESKKTYKDHHSVEEFLIDQRIFIYRRITCLPLYHQFSFLASTQTSYR